MVTPSPTLSPDTGPWALWKGLTLPGLDTGLAAGGVASLPCAEGSTLHAVTKSSVHLPRMPMASGM